MQIEQSFIDTAFAAFKGASSDVQAALIGNAGIVLTTLLTLGVTGWIAARQFRHERKERAADRALELKKEILLEGVRGAQAVLGSIGSIGTLNRSIEEILPDWLSGLGKIHTASAVANTETIRAGKDFVEHAGPVFLRLMAMRKPVEEIQNKLSFRTKQINDLFEDNQMLLARQRDAGVANNKEQVEKLGLLLNANFSRFDELDRDRDELWATMNPQHVELVRAGIRFQSELAPLLRKLIASVRLDIGVDTSSAAYYSAADTDDTQPLRVLDEVLPHFTDATPANAPAISLPPLTHTLSAKPPT